MQQRAGGAWNGARPAGRSEAFRGRQPARGGRFVSATGASNLSRCSQVVNPMRMDAVSARYETPDLHFQDCKDHIRITYLEYRFVYATVKLTLRA